MSLIGTEHQGLFPLINHRHEYFDPLLLPLLDLDNLVEVRFLINLARFYFTLYNLVIRNIDILSVFRLGFCTALLTF